MPFEGGDIDSKPSSAPSGIPSLSCEKEESWTIGLWDLVGGVIGVEDAHGEVENTGMCISNVSSSSESEDEFGEATKLFSKIPCISCPASLKRESSLHEGRETTGERHAFHGFGATIFSSASVRNTRPRLSMRMPLSPMKARGEKVLCGSIKLLFTIIPEIGRLATSANINNKMPV
jgi:hypothetical protein